MIPIGTCSKLPTKLCGRRVRVLPGEWPRVGAAGLIYGVSGIFVPPHDGLEEVECVHVAVDSGFTVQFRYPDQNWSGYPPHALELLSTRYKVWRDGEVGKTILLRTGTEESQPDFGERDTTVVFTGDDVAVVAKFACERTGHVGRVLVKNFDTEAWYTVDGD